VSSSFWDHSDRDKVIEEIGDDLPPRGGLGRLEEVPAEHLCPLREENCPLHKGGQWGVQLRRHFLWHPRP